MRISDGDVFSSSVRGNVRKQNEDSCGVFDVPNGKLYVVCDGMGGHAGGATASKLGVDSIANYFQQAKYPDVRLALANALEYANLQIIDAANEMPSLKGMGTTACVLLIQGDEAWIAHCGDSRIYLYCAEQQWLHRITKDHSYVQGLVDQGLITDAEAETHPNKNRILKALGIKAGCKPTVCEQPILPANGDTFLICSDGLSGMVNDEQLQYVLQQEGTILNKGQMMIQLALQAGGLDNITTQLIKISDSPHAHSVFVSQNPKERLTPKMPPTPLPTGGKKKSPKLMLKIMIPVVIVLLIVCGTMWILLSPPSKSNDKRTVIPSSYNANAHEEIGDMPPVDNSNSSVADNNLQSQVDETFVIEYYIIDPITHKKKKEKQGSFQQSGIKTEKWLTDATKNYIYTQKKHGQILPNRNEVAIPNVKLLYKKTTDGKNEQITIDKPQKTVTPSKKRIWVEKYKCDLYGNPSGESQVIEDIQWKYTYYENDVPKETSDYYESEARVSELAKERINNAPKTIYCKVVWSHIEEVKGSEDNKSEYDAYIKEQKEIEEQKAKKTEPAIIETENAEPPTEPILEVNEKKTTPATQSNKNNTSRNKSNKSNKSK